MLLYFKTSNNLSFNEEVEFSMVAGNYKIRNPETQQREDELPDNLHTLKNYGIDILRSSVIYGSNASGKSSFLYAIVQGILLVRNSHANSSSPEKWNYKQQVNRFNETNLLRPITYTYGFLIDEVQYEYNFSYDAEKVLEESLYEYRTQKPTQHFLRTFNAKKNNYDWEFSKYFTGGKDAVKNITNEKTLFLNIGASSGLPISEKVYDWFKNKTAWGLGKEYPGRINEQWVLKNIKNFPGYKQWLLEILVEADFTLIDIIVGEMNTATKKFDVTTVHRAIDKSGKATTVTMDYYKDESTGTRRFIGWMGLFADAVVTDRVIFLDEFGISMHTKLSKYLLDNFPLWHHGKESNAQLIFTTHDTNLLTRELFRPDQIWFTEKDEIGNSKLYPLSQFKLLKGKSIESTYLQGLYGGIPHLKVRVDEEAN